MECWLSIAADARPDHPFLAVPGDTLAFRDAEEKVRRATGALLDLGVGPGDRVGVWTTNDVPTAVALFAVPRTGAAVVPLNPRLEEEDARRRVEAARLRLLVGPAPYLGGPVVEHLDGDPAPGVAQDTDRVHTVMFTSGSSGEPRGVRLTWGNLEASADASARHLDHRPDDRWLCVLPLHHIGGLSILVRSAREATTVLLEPGFAASRAARLLHDGGATLASFVAVMLGRVLDVDEGPYRGVRAILVGGGPAPLDLLVRATEAGLPVLPTYGMTETASQIATARLPDAYRPKDRCFPLPGAEVRLDRSGTVQVRGPMVSPGYLDGPDRSSDEWFTTGDVGEIDDEGAVTVLGRADDVIVTGGENVHPVRVETVLRAHPGVEEVAVVGTPDPTWGSIVTAVYQGPASPGQLDRHARLRLAGFEVPRRWRRMERIPLLPVGKVDRAAVRRAITEARADGGGA